MHIKKLFRLSGILAALLFVANAFAFYQKLTPVDLAEVQFDNEGNIVPGKGVIENLIACRRPVITGLPNISFEEKEGKYLFHNYGHGGSGWTLLWGSVAKSIQQFDTEVAKGKIKKDTAITVIGAGIMGRVTALTLYDKGYKNISIVAKELEDIPSKHAGGYFAPAAMNIEDKEQQNIIDEIGFNSFEYYQEISAGKNTLYPAEGSQKIFVYSGAEKEVGAIETISPLEPYAQKGLIPPAEEGTVDFGNGTVHKMRKYQTFFINIPVLLKTMDSLMAERGLTIQVREVQSFAELSTPVIFNCSGLGARELNNDQKVYPGLGHLLILQEEPIDKLHYIISTRYTAVPLKTPEEKKKASYIYFIPKAGGTLGGTFIPNNMGFDKDLNNEKYLEILNLNRKFFGFKENP